MVLAGAAPAAGPASYDTTTLAGKVASVHGTAGLPASWTEPLNDHIRSAIFDFDHSRISKLAERTAALRLDGVLAPTG